MEVFGFRTKKVPNRVKMDIWCKDGKKVINTQRPEVEEDVHYRTQASLFIKNMNNQGKSLSSWV